MAVLQGKERLQPSLLDRLTDHEPTRKHEGPDQQTLSMARLRQAVLRDLGALMNTTNLAALQDLSATPRAAKSTLNYGIPSFAGMIESASRVVALEREIADAIRAFEPRIRPDTLRVRSRESRYGAANPAIVFEIEGELWAQPVPVHLFVETSIDIETRAAQVREAKSVR